MRAGFPALLERGAAILLGALVFFAPILHGALDHAEAAGHAPQVAAAPLHGASSAQSGDPCSLCLAASQARTAIALRTLAPAPAEAPLAALFPAGPALAPTAPARSHAAPRAPPLAG